MRKAKNFKLLKSSPGALLVTYLTIVSTIFAPQLAFSMESECARLLLPAWNSAISQLDAMKGRSYTENNSFDARLLQAMQSRDKRIWRNLLRSIPVDSVLKDLKHNPWSVTVSKPLITRIFEALKAEGGELRLSLSGMNYFREEDGKPIITLAGRVSEAVAVHEFQHFQDWSDLKRNLVAKGLSPLKAAKQAGLKFGSPAGIFLTEARAKSAELQENVKTFQDAIEAESNQVIFAGQSIPINRLHNVEDLFHHVGWPYFEALRRIASLREMATSFRFRATTWPRSRAEYLKGLDDFSELLLRDLTLELMKLRSSLRPEFYLRKGLFELTNVSSEYPPPLIAFFESGIRRQEGLLIDESNIDPRDQNEIEALLKRNSEIQAESGWRTDGFSKADSYGPRGFARGEQAAYNQLDLSGLGYDGEKGNLLFARRIEKELAHPLLDSSEIKTRQQAIGELLSEDGKLLTSLEVLLKEKGYWRNSILKNAVPSLENLYGDPMDLRLLYGKLPKFFRDKELTSRVQVLVDQASGYFLEVQQMRIVLAKTKSPRFKSLKWVLDSVVSDRHPYQIAGLIRKLNNPGDLQTRLDAFRELTLGHAEVANYVSRAYAEIIFYFDIARHAQKKNWLLFPRSYRKILSRGRF